MSHLPKKRVSYRPPRWHRYAEIMIKLMALAAASCVILIFLFIVREALPLFWEENPALDLKDLIWPKKWSGYEHPVWVWQPVGKIAKYNIVPLLFGTLKVTFLAMLLSAPLALGSAIYISQYARPRTRELIKPAVELLSGIPSVVLGFFALVILASVCQELFDFPYRLNGFVATLGLSMAVIPLVFTLSEDALSSVPKHLSEGALALGARRWQVVLWVTIPAAMPSLAAAMILGFGRAVGETMIVLMASGNAAVIDFTDLGSSVRTLTATIAAELGEVARGDVHWRVLFLLGSALFVVTSFLNWLGSVYVKQMTRRLTGAGRT